MGAQNINLLPPLVESGQFEQLVQSGQTISATTSPYDNSLAVFLSPTTVSGSNSNSDREEPVYFASYDVVPSSERRLFIADTQVIFSMFHGMLESAKSREPSWIQTPEALELMRKFSVDYVNFIKECWIHASQPMPRTDGPLQFSADHYRSLYSCFSLFVVLYLPEPGYEDAPVGEDLMEWLNIHFIEPSTEEGDHLSSLDRPWEDEEFWPYLKRVTLRGLTKASLFFFNTLLQHPSEDLQDLVRTIIPVVESQPRLQNFSAERDFAFASRKWKDKVKAIRIEMDRVPEESRFDDFENWWDSLSDIVGILEGRNPVIQRVCEELGADWKEVCSAWGIFVDSRLRRQDLVDVAAEVLEIMPADPTNLEDMIHSALFSGKPEQALRYASQLDAWLSAHFADVMEPLGLLETDENSESELSKRDEYVLSYAEYLHSDPTQWKITIAYMYSCGDIGRERGDEILVRVPLRLHPSEAPSTPEEAIAQAVKEVSEVCFNYQREAVRRTVCRIAAQTCVRQKDYGLAVSYCISAEDWVSLGRVIDSILDEYVHNGAAEFAKQASKIAPSVQELQSRTVSEAIFVHRLIFAVRYSQIHKYKLEQDFVSAASDIVTLLREEIAPKSWWPVLLCDSVELLQYGSTLLFASSDAAELLSKLEEISIRASQGSGDDYLSVLTRTIKGGGEKEALERLKVVRLALARYFARCTIGSDRHALST
ncbi:hypothetical protein K435DRAFT_776286 [Dendrothele bispora CBS 962.96]|uniref:Nuclear pore complex protein Nup85 n=1 Tax=Dendrothele bispora (strain CBS 962.96) TaxID=1314807 RepID=A0A4S8MDY7_DENBC|nr:hypothetical protein K435DRAFT_776286 [Dendrothele bispora CBS 962.96]